MVRRVRRRPSAFPGASSPLCLFIVTAPEHCLAGIRLEDEHCDFRFVARYQGYGGKASGRSKACGGARGRQDEHRRSRNARRNPSREEIRERENEGLRARLDNLSEALDAQTEADKVFGRSQAGKTARNV